MSKGFKEAFNGFGRELLNSIKETANEKLSDAALEERILGIKKTTIAMMDAGVDEETIIKMLQKHWDLRLSEATDFVENSKYAK